MSKLFTPCKVGELEVENRFVRSATHDFMASADGLVTERQVRLYSELSRGGVGLIMTGHAFVHPAGKASPRQIAVHDDRFTAGLASLAAAVHGSGPARVFLQLAHAGRQTKRSLCGTTPVSPSAVYDPATKVMPRELEAAEIRGLIQAFVSAAVRARAAGFDGVQIHAAHGYLLSSFLSPHTNRRADEWGGCKENRSRFLAEVISGVKAACGRDFPVAVKLNSTDLLREGGLEVEEAVIIAGLAQQSGVDAIEVSGGMAEAGRGSVWPGRRPESEEGYFVRNAALIKRSVGVPVIGLGGIRTLRVAQEMVEGGLVDLVAMSRPFIRDPRLVERFRGGLAAASDCVSCNKCFNPRGISCARR